MCKIVYLTCKRTNRAARQFRDDLADELRKRNVQVVTDYAYDLLNFFRRHETYGISLAFDFYQDGKRGCGLTLNQNCSYIGRDFAYNLSNNIDLITPDIFWRDLNFVTSEDKDWFRFFNKVSATTKAIFYLCTQNNEADWDVFSVAREEMIKTFADEAVRCLRSNYNSDNYRKRVNAARLKLKKD